MKKFLLIILSIIISTPTVFASRITDTVNNEVFQSLYGETRAQYEQRKEEKSKFYKNELSKPLLFGKKGYLKRLKYRRAIKKKLKKQHLI